MDDFWLGLGSFGVLLTLIGLRMPIGAAMLAVGALGYAITLSPQSLLAYMNTTPWYELSKYELSVVPLFLLMGQFATRAGLSRALFLAANAFVGHRRGGMAMAAIGGCAGFGAICGSSLATAATMGQVAMPEMQRFGYSGALSTGALAAGGVLGILIPPSVVLVIYALLTEQDIGRMFAAAFLPGFLAVILYVIAIAVFVRLDPEAGPAGARVNWAGRLKALVPVWPVLAIFALVLGGIYGGWFTPTEGAAVGAGATGVLALFHGLGRQGLLDSLTETAKATAMIFLIVLGADLYNSFLALTQMPQDAAAMIQNAGLAPMLVLIGILALYLALGCVMDSLSMILLTIPIFFPIVMGLDFGMSPTDTAIWFGILALIVVEVGLITPPVGMNVYVINQMARAQGQDVPIWSSFRGVIPFLAADILRIGLLLAFPGITLWLVHVLY